MIRWEGASCSSEQPVLICSPVVFFFALFLSGEMYPYGVQKLLFKGFGYKIAYRAYIHVLLLVDPRSRWHGGKIETNIAKNVTATLVRAWYCCNATHLLNCGGCPFLHYSSLSEESLDNRSSSCGKFVQFSHMASSSQ